MILFSYVKSVSGWLEYPALLQVSQCLAALGA
jgi:hypothetical protein